MGQEGHGRLLGAAPRVRLLGATLQIRASPSTPADAQEQQRIAPQRLSNKRDEDLKDATLWISQVAASVCHHTVGGFRCGA